MSQTENDLYKQALAVYLNSEKDTRPYWETDHRGMVMPLVKSGYNNSVSYGVPGILGGSAWGTLNDIIEGRQVAKGEIEQAAGDAAGAAMTGSFALSRPTGSIGSGGRIANELPMDQASRMARAKEMGFDTDKVFYHGTNKAFDEFKLKDGGIEKGFFFSDNPQYVSDLYASAPSTKQYRSESAIASDIDAAKASVQAAYDHAVNSGDWSAWQTASQAEKTLLGEMSSARFAEKNRSSPSVIPVFLRTGSQKTVNTSGDLSRLQNAGQIEAAKAEGFDSLLLRHPNGTSETVAFDPRNIRSVNAAFDPAMADSANLLAANAPTSAAAPSLQHIIDALMRRDEQSRQ